MTEVLFTITHSWDHRDDGITVCPGVPSEMVDEIEGAHLSCKRPDGKVTQAVVSAISRLCQAPDERLALCLGGGITLDDVPTLNADDIAKKEPHMRKLLALCKKHDVDRWSEGWSLEQAIPVLQKFLAQVAPE